MARNLISSDSALKAKLKTITPDGHHSRICDGDGLYLRPFVKGGSHAWRFDYTFVGRRNTLSLGTYPDVGLADARRKADDYRRLVATGTDPSQARADAKAKAAQQREAKKLTQAGLPCPGSLEAVARAWIGSRAGAWKPGTLANITAALETHVFPAIGAKPIASVKPAEIRGVVQEIEARGASETAGRVFQRLRAICRYAIAHDHLEIDPTYPLKRGEILKPYRVKHRAALSEKELPSLLRALAEYGGQPSTRLALSFLMLTAVRPGELRGARWEEFELEADRGPIWRIPASRMKMDAEHIVPLSKQALAVLATAKPLSNGQGLVFPAAHYPGKSLSENTLNSALARMGYKGSHTAHGFRALFSTIANEKGQPADAIERQLAHIERNAVRAAYHRGEHIEQRRALMQWWADCLEDKAKGAQLIALRGKAA